MVADASCTLADYHTYGYKATAIGALIGGCQAELNPCTIENVVSSASIASHGNTNEYLAEGGIAGFLWNMGYSSGMKNCVNYGPIDQHGRGAAVFIGGIVGLLQGDTQRFSLKNTECMPIGGTRRSIRV